MEKKYFFITFFYGASEKRIENGVIDMLPLEWQKQRNKEQYVLERWREITKEDYEAAGPDRRV